MALHLHAFVSLHYSHIKSKYCSFLIIGKIVMVALNQFRFHSHHILQQLPPSSSSLASFLNFLPLFGTYADTMSLLLFLFYFIFLFWERIQTPLISHFVSHIWQRVIFNCFFLLQQTIKLHFLFKSSFYEDNLLTSLIGWANQIRSSLTFYNLDELKRTLTDQLGNTEFRL